MTTTRPRLPLITGFLLLARTTVSVMVAGELSRYRQHCRAVHQAPEQALRWSVLKA